MYVYVLKTCEEININFSARLVDEGARHSFLTTLADAYGRDRREGISIAEIEGQLTADYL